MKKLMTILSATAFAVIAVGAVNGDELNTGTGFETGAYSLGGNLNTEKDDVGDDLEDEAYRVWGSIPDLESGVAVVSNWNGEYEVADGNNQYLKLDSAPLISRYAQAGGTAVDIGDGLYIDTLVQFTAADSAPTPEGEGDKLCIWLRDDKGAEVSENETFTLMVTAGFVEDDMGNVFPTNYATSTTIENNSWHRLQVKVLADIDSEGSDNLGDGFVVFIDGTAVATTTCPIDANYISDYTLNPRAAEYFNEGAYAIFPSMLKSGGTITSLSFKGTGAVDNIAFSNGDDIDPIEVTIPTPKLGLVADGSPKTGVTYDEDLEGTAFELDGDAVTQTQAGDYTTTFKLFVGYAWVGGSTEDYDVDWSIAAGSGGSGFDGGEAGKSFSIDSETQAELTATLVATYGPGTKLSDYVNGTSGMTYAQAYALGLLDDQTGDVEDLNATIEFTAEGKVKVSLDVTTTYKVTLKVYEKASLTEAWPAEAKATYVLGSATEAAGFAPGSGSGSETSEFYKVAIAIENAD